MEEFGALRDAYMRAADVFLAMYSITSLSSFEELDVFLEQVYRVRETVRITTQRSLSVLIERSIKLYIPLSRKLT